MNFDEALKMWKALPVEKVFTEDIKMKAFVVPQIEDDFRNYLNAFSTSDGLTNEQAKLFSSNNQYSVCWLHYDGADMFFDFEK